VIKHTDYAECVSEDPVALPRHRWNRGRRRATICGRERERGEINNDEATMTRVTGGGEQGPASGGMWPESDVVAVVDQR
jgi:hypothetical protein